jgi:opacity protein-like surface antigen
MNRSHVAAAVLALAVMQPAIAEAKMKLYAMMSYVSPLAESDQNVGGVTDAVKASSEFGYNFGLEFRAGSMIGIELDYLYAKQDVEHDTAGLLGETTFQPISGTLNLHFPLGGLDLYGGPTAAYVNWGDLEIPSGGEVEIDPEFAFGLSAGVDIGVGPSLALTGGLRWLSVGAEPEGGDEVSVDPLFARFGVALLF